MGRKPVASTVVTGVIERWLKGRNGKEAAINHTAALWSQGTVKLLLPIGPNPTMRGAEKRERERKKSRVTADM